MNGTEPEKFGIATLDSLLGGGITPGSAILMISEHPSTQFSNFSDYFAGETIRKSPDSKVILINYGYPAHHVEKIFITEEM
ncbi:MAG: hypothetical protein ACXQS8_05195, partial [Candidatus Helarchaeales archaeon]